MIEGNSALQFGLMNSLRTGNMIFDALLCMMVPMAMTHLCGAFAVVVPFLKKIYHLYFPTVSSREIMYVRSIEVTQRYDANGYAILDKHLGDDCNDILQQAITLYISKFIRQTSISARMMLYQKKENAQNNVFFQQQQKFDVLDDEEDDAFSPISKLKTMEITTMPSINEWIPIKDDVEFQCSVTQPNDQIQKGGSNESKAPRTSNGGKSITYFLRSSKPDGKSSIEGIINDAFEEYKLLKKNSHKKDTNRYMFVMSETSSTEKELPEYKEYKLSDEKTFRSLFFPQKNQLLELLDNFSHKKDKFAIEGFPHKLGLLMHGPPGTGKTSLIKAIAHHTNRHIVSISLSKISSNQQLMDLMFNLQFVVQGREFPVRLNFQKIVFVMEDIDCASSIVRSREKTSDLGNDNEVDIMKVLANLQEGPTCPVGPSNQKKSMVGISSEDFFKSRSDKLNLSGLLNVLDGVVDSPGRIVIMTSNHPDQLDPALIRPGRINKKIELGFMGIDQCIEMIEHYFQIQLSELQDKKIRKIFFKSNRQYTPAEVEEYCVEYKSIDELLSFIENR